MLNKIERAGSEEILKYKEFATDLVKTFLPKTSFQEYKDTPSFDFGSVSIYPVERQMTKIGGRLCFMVAVGYYNSGNEWEMPTEELVDVKECCTFLQAVKEGILIETNKEIDKVLLSNHLAIW